VTPGGGAPAFGGLAPGAIDAAVLLATQAFAGHRFYQRVLGLDAATFAVYWQEFLAWAARDESIRIFTLSVEERPLALLVAADPRFPTLSGAIRFLRHLARRIGLRRCWAYLRFATAYQRFMRRPRRERNREMRGLWLLVAPRGDAVGLGRRLVRGALRAVAADGYTVITGLIDGSDRRLACFYRRVGFRVSAPARFRGLPTARIELHQASTMEDRSCRC
jgi:hypothetical protein